MIYRMSNPTQAYAWGSRVYIQELTGATKLIGSPLAELWLGAHPKAPSIVSVIPDGIEIPLPDLIAADSDRHLGPRHAQRFGRLPFLMKVLAARIPLSVQAHPNLAQAREGFARENRLGIPLDDPKRNYRDDNHKPELICALTPFKAMCGFLPYERIIANLRASGLGSALDGFAEFEQDPCADTLRALFLGLLAVAAARRRTLVSALLDALERMEDPQIREYVLILAKSFPEDIGIYAPLFLNLIGLQPGQAIYLEAGILHAYLEGSGIEIMANSDNVLRGGLTPKHIDLEELAKVLSFEPYVPEVLGSESAGQRLTDYRCPVAEYRLSRLQLDGSQDFMLLQTDSPRILLCVEGRCAFSGSGDHTEEATICQGQSIYMPAGEGDILLAGNATIFIAECGD